MSTPESHGEVNEIGLSTVEVKKVMANMKKGKVVGLGGITVETSICLANGSIQRERRPTPEIRNKALPVRGSNGCGHSRVNLCGVFCHHA